MTHPKKTPDAGSQFDDASAYPAGEGPVFADGDQKFPDELANGAPESSYVPGESCDPNI